MTMKTTKQDLNDKSKENRHHIHWAPLRGIPLERRLQTTAVCIWIVLAFSCFAFFLYLFTYIFLWPVLILYITFLYVDKAPENGGRCFERTRDWILWKYFANYFPIKLIKASIKLDFIMK